MTVELSPSLAQALRALAERQGREVTALVAEAVQQYLAAATVTDLTSAEVGEGQMALAAELGDTPSWGGHTR